MSPARAGVSAVAARQEPRIATRDTRRIVFLPFMFRRCPTTGDVFALIAKVVPAATAGQYDRRAWRPRARGVCPPTAAQHRAAARGFAHECRLIDVRPGAGSRFRVRLRAVAALADLHRRVAVRRRAGVALRPDPADARERQDAYF